MVADVKHNFIWWGGGAYLNFYQNLDRIIKTKGTYLIYLEFYSNLKKHRGQLYPPPLLTNVAPLLLIRTHTLGCTRYCFGDNDRLIIRCMPKMLVHDSPEISILHHVQSYLSNQILEDVSSLIFIFNSYAAWSRCLDE